MTHFSFKYFLRFAWGIFTGEILLFHNLHLSPGTDLQYKDKKDEQVTTEELMRIKKITGHYLVKDYSTHMEHYAKFEDKPKHKTALLNRLTSNSLRPGILGCVWLFNIQCFFFMTFNLGSINLGLVKNRTPYSILECLLVNINCSHDSKGM